jgi:hypothetical protein
LRLRKRPGTFRVFFFTREAFTGIFFFVVHFQKEATMWPQVYNRLLFPVLKVTPSTPPTETSKAIEWCYSIIHGESPSNPLETALTFCLLSELTLESEKKPRGRSNLWLTERASESSRNQAPVVKAWTYNCEARAYWWTGEDNKKALNLSELALAKCDFQNPEERDIFIAIAIDHCHLLTRQGKAEECKKVAQKIIGPQDDPQSNNDLLLLRAQLDPEAIFRRRWPFPRI